MALERQVVTISKGIEVLEHEGQRVLINPVNREWIKLADYAYDLALNPEGKPVSRLIADEALRSGAEPEIIRALFQYLKEYRFVAEVSDVVTLARAYLNVTARCNLTCPMCYFADNDLPGHAESSSELSYEALCLTIDALAKTDLSNLVISGGEPLLYQDFCRILNYAKEKISRITILTNGTLTTKEYAEHISKANARVQVSIESANSRVHDSIRGRGSFDKAIEGIKMLLHAGVDDIEIVQTLTRESISESESVVKLAGKLGVGYHFSLFLPVGRGTCHIGDLEIPADELLRHFVRICSESLEGGRGLGPHAHEIRDTAHSGDLIPPSGFAPPVELVVKQRCGAGSSIISIAPDGKVYPCPLLHAEGMVLGELPKEPVWEIVRRGTSKIQDVAGLRECSDCDVALFCGGGCRARAFAHTGDVSSKDPYCEFYRRIFLAVLWEWRDDKTFSDNMDAILSCIRERE
ncbi:MAG TPA: radical SAM protein [Firmicutes bacterium]|nr:radical SAM protein [Bacillota bacterium]